MFLTPRPEILSGKNIFGVQCLDDFIARGGKPIPISKTTY